MVHFGGSWSLLFNNKVNVKIQELNVNNCCLNPYVVIVVIVKHENNVNELTFNISNDG